MSQNTLIGKAAVLEGLAAHPAVKAILAWNPEALVDAKFDRGELTLTIAAGEIRAAAATVQAAGYNFFEDVTAVDWFPSSPRFQLSYHIVSHTYKERIRLRVLVDGDAPAVESITSGLALGQFLRARGLRPFRNTFRGASQPAPHHDARRLARPSAAQGLSGGGVSLNEIQAHPSSKLLKPKARAISTWC